MAQIYTKRLCGPTLLTNAADVTLFTVPTDHVYVVRSLLFWTNSGSCRYVLAIGTTLTVGNRVVNQTTAETDWRETRLELHAGESLHGLASTSGGGYLTLTGYDFVD